MGMLAACLLAGCSSTVEIPQRSVPDGLSLTESQRRSYLDAARAIGEGRFDDAQRDLAPLLQVRPIHVPSHILRQDLSKREGAPEALRAEYDALAASLPADSGALLLRGRLASMDLRSRIEIYAAAAALSTTDPWPRIALALGRAEQARAMDSRAEERAREGFRDEQARLRLAALAVLDRARADAASAVALAPGLSSAHAAMGWVESTSAVLLGREEAERGPARGRAIVAFEQAIVLDPGDVRCRIARATLRLQTGVSVADVLPDLEAAVALAPADLEARKALARVLSEARHPDAVAAWEVATILRPEDGDLLVELGRALVDVERWDDALDVFRRASATYRAHGVPAWHALRGEFTVLAQRGVDTGSAEDLAEARRILQAYREAGGPDTAWAEGIDRLLTEPEEVAPE
jgi:tetratricopeptide (TPR) repeat protein